MYKYLKISLIMILLTIMSADFANASEKKPFGYEEAMKFKSLRARVISDYGNWLGYTAIPDRGDATAYIVSLSDTVDKRTYEIPRGGRITFAKDEQWAATMISPKALDKLNEKDKSKLKKELDIIDLNTGDEFKYKDVKRYKFSQNGLWLAFEYAVDKKAYPKSIEKKPKGKELVLKHLASGTDIKIDWVTSFEFDSLGRYFFYSISDPDCEKDGIYYRDLRQDFAPQFIVENQDSVIYSDLAWNHSKNVLAFTKSKFMKKGRPDSTNICLWLKGNKKIIDIVEYSKSPKGWYIPFKNRLAWTDDGNRLFFGFKPIGEKDTVYEEEKNKFTEENYYDRDKILKDKDVYVWHWNDDRISTHQRKWWAQNKDRTYRSVYHLKFNKWVQLADSTLPEVIDTDNPFYATAYNKKPYLKEITWNYWHHDAYVVNLETGEKTLIIKKLIENLQLAPLGKKVAYFKNPHWYVYDMETKMKRNVSIEIKSSFADTDGQVPAEPTSYGFFGWGEKDEAIYVYDKHDMWKFNTNNSAWINVFAADGKVYDYKFRLVNFNKWKKKYIGFRDTMLLTTYSFKNKWQNLGLMTMNISGAYSISQGTHQTTKWLGKSKYSNKYLFSRESYSKFPDIWAASITPEYVLTDSVQVTDVNPEMKDYEWGHTKIYRFANSKGDSLDGYLIMPEGFDSTKKYPLLVYIYEKFSFRTFGFYTPRVNHRPAYQIYNSSGYIVFVPDIDYTVGKPGDDALDCVNGAVDMLVSKGFVDEKRVCLQGHSWGAYETAYIATQSDRFVAACAGAPVGNMTSAYSGIRLGTGLARQFQYEKTQSRIGGSIFDSLGAYIQSSPVFEVNKANTPLLIMHGDIDGAVPWQQSIEIYLAYRRLSKNCIFLQYQDEPHWPGRYPNKLDWSYRMKEFFDHYCLDTPAPKWMKEGEPYKGK